MQWLIDIIVEAVIAQIQGTRLLVFRRTSAQAVGGAWEIIKFNDIVFDTKSEFFGLTSRFTAKTTGYHKITWQVGWRPALAADRKFFASMFVNGTQEAMGLEQSSHSDYLATKGSILYHLDVDDVVDIRGLQTSGFDVNIDYTNDLTYLCIDRKV